LTFAAGHFIGTLLYGISPYNAFVAIIAVAALGLSALTAALIPAFRASLVSPLDALRTE
jgi:ABC-type lipoprotein release transport system permease subunit